MTSSHRAYVSANFSRSSPQPPCLPPRPSTVPPPQSPWPSHWSRYSHQHGLWNGKSENSFKGGKSVSKGEQGPRPHTSQGAQCSANCRLSTSVHRIHNMSKRHPSILVLPCCTHLFGHLLGVGLPLSTLDGSKLWCTWPGPQAVTRFARILRASPPHRHLPAFLLLPLACPPPLPTSSVGHHVHLHSLNRHGAFAMSCYQTLASSMPLLRQLPLDIRGPLDAQRLDHFQRPLLFALASAT